MFCSSMDRLMYGMRHNTQVQVDQENIMLINEKHDEEIGSKVKTLEK